MCDNVKNSGVGRRLKSMKSLDFSLKIDKIREAGVKFCKTIYGKRYEFSIKNGFLAYL